MNAFSLKEQSGSEHGDTCDTCNTAFFCSRLHTIRSMLKGTLDDIGIDEPTLRRLREIDQQLEAARFAYPDGKSTCEFAASPNGVRLLTDELIRLAKKCSAARGNELPGRSDATSYNTKQGGST